MPFALLGLVIVSSTGHVLGAPLLLRPVGDAQDGQKPVAATLYEYGTGLLKRGKLTKRAIEALESAVKLEPRNRKYWSALGSAYASRFAWVAAAYRQARAYPSAKTDY